VIILSDFRLDEQIDREAPQARKVIRKKEMFEEVKMQVDKVGINKLGVQANDLTIEQRKQLVKQVGAKNIKHIDDGLLKQRAVKSPEEVKLIRAALKIQQQAYREFLDYVKPGMTEYEVCAFLEYRMRALGADGTSFNTIMAAEPNGSLCHYFPGKTKVRAKRSLLIDWGARYQGYCSDLTRTIAFGSMPRKIKDIYPIVLEAQLTAIDLIGPGVPLADVDKAARDVITRAGFGEQFGHGLGHGIGLQVHEQPVLSGKSKGSLEAGHIVTVEPGIYLPGVGGVRIEDDVLVTAKGKEVLSDLPKDLDSAII